jgi:GT2 family glycosyltransferase
MIGYSWHFAKGFEELMVARPGQLIAPEGRSQWKVALRPTWNGPVRISLIITTYEWPQALDLVLTSVSRQTRLPEEIIVADDGSGKSTVEVVSQWRNRLSVPVVHLWQENKGFRAARSRNRAIAAARGQYLLLVDGDMVLDRHFVADHAQAAEPGCFVQGVRIAMDPRRSALTLENRATSFSPFTLGLNRPLHAIRSPRLSQRFTHDSVVMSHIKSCNQGHWREDLLATNGFDERMIGWGPEDKECAVRLLHSGLRCKSVRFAALAAHLHHASRAPVGANPNDALLADTIANRRTRCELGVDQHLAEFAAGVPGTAQPPWVRRGAPSASAPGTVVDQNRRLSASVAP